MKTYRTSSSKETQLLAETYAKKLVKQRAAFVIALQGDLGTGKTTFVQGFLRGLGSKKRAQSPTFIIMRRHGLAGGASNRGKRAKHFKNVFHVDAYRLKEAKHLKILGFNEILQNPENVILVEWPERAKKILPKSTVWISFAHGKKENERTIRVTGKKI